MKNFKSVMGKNILEWISLDFKGKALRNKKSIESSINIEYTEMSEKWNCFYLFYFYFLVILLKLIFFFDVFIINLIFFFNYIMEVALAVGVVEAFIICIEGLVVISFTTFGLDIGGPSIFSNHCL